MQDFLKQHNFFIPAHEKINPKDILEKQFPELMADCLKNTDIPQIINVTPSNQRGDRTIGINERQLPAKKYDLHTLKGFEDFYKTVRPAGQDKFVFTPDGRVTFQNVGTDAEYILKNMQEYQELLSKLVSNLRSYFAEPKKIDFPQAYALSQNVSGQESNLGAQISRNDVPVYIKFSTDGKKPGDLKKDSAAFEIGGKFDDIKDSFFYISEQTIDSAAPRITKIPTEPGQYIVGKEGDIKVSNKFISRQHFVITVTADSRSITIKEIDEVANKTVLANYTHPMQVQGDLHEVRNSKIENSLKHELMSLYRQELLNNGIVLSPTEIEIMTGPTGYREFNELQYNEQKRKFDFGKDFGTHAGIWLSSEKNKTCLKNAKRKLAINNPDWF